MKNSRTKSLLMLISSMLIFGTIGVFRRFIPLPSATLACVRGLIGGIFLVLVVLIKKHSLKLSFSARQVLLFALTGVLLGLNWILLFESYNYTSVAVGTLCYYMEPTIVILLSPLLFREKLTPKKLICAAVSLIGIALVSGIADVSSVGARDVKGILLGLGAAVLYSAVVIMNKKNPSDDAYGKTIIELLSAAVVLLPYVIVSGGIVGVEVGTTALIMTAVVAVVHTGVAYALYFGSMAALPSQTVAVMSYIDPVFAVILSATLLKEKITVYALVGAIMIIGAAVAYEVEVKKKK